LTDEHHDVIIIMMRTTLNLPDDVFAAAKSLSAQRQLSIGDALAELVRRGLNPGPAINLNKEFPCFATSADAEPITLEHTLELEDEW
jgi:hypothetical protein